MAQSSSMIITIIILLSSITSMVSCSKPDTSYTTNCASVVPQSTPLDPEFIAIPFPQNQDGVYLGGDGLFGGHDQNSSQNNYYYYSSSVRKIMLFQTHHVYDTDADGIYMVKASLIIQPEKFFYGDDLSYSYSYSSGGGSLSFEVEGFWSKLSGKMCLVGSSSSDSQGGEFRLLHAVLKLYGVGSTNIITSLVKGTLDSLSSADDSSYFKPISFLMFPKLNCKFSNHGCKGGIDVPKGESLSLPLSKSVCSVLSRINSFQTENSLLDKGVGSSSHAMSLSFIQCSDDKQSLRFLVEFSSRSHFSYYYSPFNASNTLVAEGSWDAKKNQFCAIACRILDATNSLNSSRIEDGCAIRLSLRFPSTLSITNTKAVVGEIWSTKNVNDPEYFNKTTFSVEKGRMHGIPGLKYNYTLIDKAKKYCSKKPNSIKMGQYPDANSYEMRFDMSIRNSSGTKIGYGYSEPIFVGNQVAPWRYDTMSWSSFREANSLVQVKTSNNSQINISYKMSLPSFNASSSEYRGVQMLAEGIYDSGTGDLCMVGCRSLDEINHTSANASMDCGILVKLQFPPMSSNKYIQGTIQSTKEKSDPLYFGSLLFSAVSFSSRYASESIWRMDLEIIMALISNTLVCFFVVCQIFYVRKHQGALPFVSLLMLVVLTLGHMIPLVLNFEALFFTKQNQRNFLRRDGGWLEVNEMLVRVLTMVAFLLQFRLLQIAVSSRLANVNKKSSWAAEKKTLYVSLLLYICGGLLALVINWRNYGFDHRKMDRGGLEIISTNSNQHDLWVDLRSYARLILDGFLLPQILLNVFRNSGEAVLSHYFYVGITFVRLLPHAYHLYRTRYNNDDFDWLYMYANPSADYYSTAWDVIILFGGLLFAAIVFLQQQFGGRCFLAKKFKGLEGYEKVAVVIEA